MFCYIEVAQYIASSNDKKNSTQMITRLDCMIMRNESNIQSRISIESTSDSCADMRTTASAASRVLAAMLQSLISTNTLNQ